MYTFTFRPGLESLEERATPATTAQIQAAAAETQYLAAQIRTFSHDFEWMSNPRFRSFVENYAKNVWFDGTAEIKTFQEAGASIRAQVAAQPALAGALGPHLGYYAQLQAQAQSNMAFARNLGAWLGFSVVAPVAVKPPTAPNDSGMTNTMPNVTDPSWVTGANGLKTWDVVTGTGTPVAAGSSITVFYTGWLASNGTQFDARRSPAAPVAFSLSGLIQGWQQGIPGMQPGGIRRLFVPAALGYGAAGSPPNVPANADLVFEIKLISHT
jgi:FKBP-type peptidyl-prolyl cis-trans isomerase FkpA